MGSEGKLNPDWKESIPGPFKAISTCYEGSSRHQGVNKLYQQHLSEQLQCRAEGFLCNSVTLNSTYVTDSTAQKVSSCIPAFLLSTTKKSVSLNTVSKGETPIPVLQSNHATAHPFSASLPHNGVGHSTLPLRVICGCCEIEPWLWVPTLIEAPARGAAPCICPGSCQPSVRKRMKKNEQADSHKCCILQW